MASRAAGLPKPGSIQFFKTQLLAALAKVDQDIDAQQRITGMEADFRTRIKIHLDSLANASKPFRRFNTNPFVLLFYANQKDIRHVRNLEDAIVPAKVFSSMETSAGRTVERVVLSHYGWECVDSAMHTTESVVDGRKLDGGTLRLVTLKSGPRCINDSMTDSISSEVVKYAASWANESFVSKVEFTVGILYGTPRMSNKKDWHILRKASLAVKAMKGNAKLLVPPEDRWDCQFEVNGVEVVANVRLGKSLWDSMGDGGDAYTELMCAAIRSCVEPTNQPTPTDAFQIPDLASTIQLPSSYASHNFTVLQRSQLECFC